MTNVYLDRVQRLDGLLLPVAGRFLRLSVSATFARRFVLARLFGWAGSVLLKADRFWFSLVHS